MYAQRNHFPEIRLIFFFGKLSFSAKSVFVPAWISNRQIIINNHMTQHISICMQKALGCFLCGLMEKYLTKCSTQFLLFRVFCESGSKMDFSRI